MATTALVAPATEIEVHWTCLDEYPPTEDLACLDRDEIERADRFRIDRDRRRYIARRRWLRERLAARVGRPSGRIEIRSDPGGKPHLADHSIAFSAAHSNGIALLAIGDVATVGCDLEWRDPDADIAPITALFSDVEQSALARLAARDRSHGLYLAWTCKEAFLKATGEGLTRPLDSFDVAVDPQAPPALLRGCRNWSIRCLAPFPGYQAAIVAPGDWRLRTMAPDSPLPAAP
jgi:4'-phosphopantetheinyl transferase